MTWKKIVFERQKLFDEVWDTPVSRLAKSFKLSDVGLRKICIALDIPLPPRGYWAMPVAGRSNKKPSLKEATGRTTYEHIRHEAAVDEALHARIASARELSAATMASAPDYRPPTSSEHFQSQAIVVIKAMKKIKVKEGALSITGVCWTDISVSEQLRDRALVLVDRAAYELATLGAQFENSHPVPPLLHHGARRNPDQERNCFDLHGHKFFLRIREKITTEPIPVEQTPNKSGRKVSEFRRQQYRYISTGELHVCIVDAQRYYERYKIQHSARGTIELKLRKTLRDAEELTLRWKLDRELWAEREAIRKGNAQNWELVKKTKSKLLSKLASYESMAKDLDRARSMRRFIAEIAGKE